MFRYLNYSVNGAIKSSILESSIVTYNRINCCILTSTLKQYSSSSSSSSSNSNNNSNLNNSNNNVYKGKTIKPNIYNYKIKRPETTSTKYQTVQHKRLNTAKQRLFNSQQRDVNQYYRDLPQQEEQEDNGSGEKDEREQQQKVQQHQVVDQKPKREAIYDYLDLSIPSTEESKQLVESLLERIKVDKEYIDQPLDLKLSQPIKSKFYQQSDIDSVNQTHRKAFELAKSYYVSGLYDKAFKIFTEEIESTHGMRNVFLGNMYLTGVHVKGDLAEAYRYFEMASHSRLPVAMGMLGEMNLKGMGVALNEPLARTYFDIASSMGLRSSTEQLVYMIINSIGGSFNLQKACFYLKELARLGDTQALTTLGSLLYEHHKHLSIDLWKYASRHANQDALHYLGRYYYGRENPDYNHALTLWSMASEKGHPESQFYLGTMYEMGLMVERNLQRAFQLYSSSAQQGNKDAQYLVGKFYLDGYGGVPENRQEAVKWLELSAEQGDTSASELLKYIHQESNSNNNNNKN